ncbi:nuclear factor interleukin-3-regulated protein-like [Genypterus blacodes]|uniref:nuclear factor interleukin-3-regulated protein-like n=1 Tax=Genypterus blacodes TaxID=154954 RepID=UPI003F764991
MDSMLLPFHQDENDDLHVQKELILGSRRKREFIPDEKKDNVYWEKRRKNNEAAKRSREKRRINDYVLENHLMAMKEENARLNAELLAIKIHFGLAHPAVYSGHQRSHLPHRVYGTGTQPISSTSTHHPSLQRDYFRGERDPSVLPNHQPTQPIFIPAYSLHALRGYSYLSMADSAGSGLLNPLVPSPNLPPAHPSCPAAPILRPIPTRATSDEEEQQETGVRSPSCAAPPHKVGSRAERRYAPPR